MPIRRLIRIGQHCLPVVDLPAPQEFPVPRLVDPSGVRCRRPMRDAAGADQGDAFRRQVRGAAQGLTERPRSMQRRERRSLAVDVHGDDRQIVSGGQKAQGHHDAMIELPFLCVREIHGLHHFADQTLRQRRIAGNDGARNAQPLRIFDRSFVALRHAHRECGHVVHEKIGEVLGGDHDQGIGPRRGKFGGHAAIGAVELLDDGFIGHVRAAGDAGSMTADAREHQAHRSATLSSNPVVIA